jgi:hypothetical protein
VTVDLNEDGRDDLLILDYDSSRGTLYLTRIG